MSEEQLISVPNEQPTIALRASTGSSNKKALKVAGLAVLAALLIAGQAFTAYSVYKQSEKLSLLERRSDRLQEMTVRARANRTPMKMAVPMSSFPLLVSDFSDKKVESTPPPKAPLTKCQQEAAGLVQVSLPLFKPKCDEHGAYEPEQCWQNARCWCVDENGTAVADSVVEGRAQCSATKV
ncbi:CD74 molecule, major histocompatibility complex, class II invariant chain b [Ictalurus punctatus]|uniref:CD74 molecule, major histocompatibility complex, class II invariant chain b n=1 Tax=Ictalurus punctatus TaxID=7998 RepID=A0A2D0SY29_ICTPU|nr:CD74 molecule, major histocompatibility complex, class II invariant chain b [Ictalurus punctatus]